MHEEKESSSSGLGQAKQGKEKESFGGGDPQKEGSPVPRKSKKMAYSALIESATRRLKEKSRTASNGCIEWHGWINASGYGVMGALGKRTRLAHRISWIVSNGEIPEGLCVLHKCDNPKCINPDHLWLGTNIDNVADRCRKGRTNVGWSPGEKCGQSKLKEKQVRLILQDQRTHQEIADFYGVSRPTITLIKNKVTWRHLS